MVDAYGRPITAGFGGMDIGNAGVADSLGLGSAQLQAVSNALAAPASEAPKTMIATHNAFTSPAIQSGPTKLFVGSIPQGTTQEMIKDKFGEHGPVAEVFTKNDQAEPGRMWGFVTFVNPQSSASAVAAFNEQFVFPNAQRPLAVSFARSSSGGGGGMDAGGGFGQAALANPVMQPAVVGGMGGPTKLFIGSIPAGTTKEQINFEFGKFGAVMDVFLKQDSAEPGRMWGFLTYDSAAAAQAAVSNLHERLVLPGGSRPCAVSFARNSQAQHSMAAQNLATSSVNPVAGATKLFIGTIPKGTTEPALRFEFEKFGQVTEVFLKNDASDPMRMWGFLSYAEPQSAAVAVSALHEKLMMPGSVRPLAVSFAKNAGRGGQPGQQQPQLQVAQPILGLSGGAAPALGADGTSSWKVYYTAQGLPYYHNTLTGITQWECPPEYPGGPAPVLTDPASAAGGLSQQQVAATSQTQQAVGAGSLGLGTPASGFSAVAPASDTQRYSPF